MIYIVTSTTTNVPNLSSGPVMGVHGSLKEANAHMSMCVESVAGGKLCWDNPSKPDGNSFPPEYRRAMIARPDGGSTVITIQGWDIRRAKRAVKVEEAIAEPDVQDESTDPTQAIVDLLNKRGIQTD